MRAVPPVLGAPGFRPARPPGTMPGTRTLRDAVRDVFAGVDWTLVYVAFLAYVFVITTYRVPGANIAMLVAMAGLLFQRTAFRFPAPAVLFVAFLVWCSLGAFGHRYAPMVLHNLTEFTKIAAIFVVALNALRTPRQIRFFIIFWVLCFTLFPLRGTFVNYFVVGYTVFGRALWNYIYANPNDLAGLALLHLSLAAGLLASERQRWIRWCAGAGVGALTLLVVLTQSRGALLGLMVFGLFALAAYKRRARALAVAAAVVLLVAFMAPDTVWDRVGGLRHVTATEDLAAVDEEGSAEQRFAIWQTSFQIIRDHPVFGVGWGAYSLANEWYAPLDGTGLRQLGARDVHSTYLGVLAETGVVGFALFIAMILSVVVPAERIRRRCQAMFPLESQQLFYMQLGLLAFAVAGIFATYPRLSFLYIHLAIIFALSRALQSSYRRETAKRRRSPSIADPELR